jgi:hypothetical protein
MNFAIKYSTEGSIKAMYASKQRVGEAGLIKSVEYKMKNAIMGHAAG